MKERTEFDFGRLNSLANRRLLCTGRKREKSARLRFNNLNSRRDSNEADRTRENSRRCRPRDPEGAQSHRSNSRRARLDRRRRRLQTKGNGRGDRRRIFRVKGERCRRRQIFYRGKTNKNQTLARTRTTRTTLRTAITTPPRTTRTPIQILTIPRRPRKRRKSYR